jgi:hypothetical protein
MIMVPRNDQWLTVCFNRYSSRGLQRTTRIRIAVTKEAVTSGSRDRRATRQIVLGRSILVDRFEFSGDRIQETRYRPAQLRSKRDATMKKLCLVAVAGLALSSSAVGRVYHRRLPPPPPPPPACNPVASWTDVNSNVCIKYVCAGGGFQIRCLPAPPLLPGGPGPGPVQ